MTISSQIIEVLNHLCLKFGLAIDWTQDNIIPYLQTLADKYVSWEVATSWTWIYICIAFAILSIVLIIIDCMTEFSEGFMTFLCAIVIIVCIIIAIVQIFDIVMCNHFPEKAVLDYVKYLMANS